MRNRVKRAFTLIEILIVVVILGILAAIVIPQFTDASEEAMDSSVRSQLQTIRAQIELFQVQNPNVALDNTNLWNYLVDGVAGVGGDYLQQAPRNPLQPALTATAVGAGPGPAAEVAWYFDANGDFQATDGEGNAFVE